MFLTDKGHLKITKQIIRVMKQCEPHFKVSNNARSSHISMLFDTICKEKA